MDETPTYLYIYFKFFVQQSPSVTHLNVLNFHCGKRGRTTGILGFLYNSWNITFQDVLWMCTSIKWRHAYDFLIECVKNTICVIFSACRKFEKRNTQKVGIQLLFLSHSAAPSNLTQCCDVQKPPVLIVKCFVAGKENSNITRHWLPVLLWWNINEKEMYVTIHCETKCLFCQYFYGMHMKKPNTMVAPDDNKFRTSANISSNETGKQSFLLILLTVTT